jgi:uncharacterized membrane protein YkvA (DUF1232 family)
MGLKERAARLKIDIPAVYLALKKPSTPWYAKVLAVLTVGYALSPIDLIPDFIPVLGYLDDLLILPLLVFVTVKLIPEDEFARCRVEAEGLWKGGRPKKWYYAIPVVLIWGVVIWLIVRAILT